MTTRLTYSRERDGSFNLSEARLAPFADALYADGNSEPRVPYSFATAVARELVSAMHRAADARRVTLSQAAGIVARERPALCKISRCEAVHDGDRTADVELDA